MEDNSKEQEINEFNLNLGISPLNIFEALDDSPMFRQKVMEIEEVKLSQICIIDEFL